MANPDRQISGGLFSKKIFKALWASVWSNNKEGEMQTLEILRFDMQNLEISRFDMRNLEISIFGMQNIEISRNK